MHSEKINYPEGEGSDFDQNTLTYLQIHMASYPETPVLYFITFDCFTAEYKMLKVVRELSLYIAAFKSLIIDIVT